MPTYADKPVDIIKKAIGCAQHYGFRSVEDIAEEYSSLGLAPTKKVFDKKLGSVLSATHRKVDPASREFESALRQLALKKLYPYQYPILFYTSNINCSDNQCSPDLPRNISLGFHTLGMRHSVAEALILKVATSITQDLALPQSCVYINSLGDRDSSAKFSRETTQFLRKHINSLPPAIREHMKEDVHLAYAHLAKKDVPLEEELPRPMEFLTSASRRHLREVLEFLEAADIPYVFDERVFGHRDCFNHTLFELRAEDDEVEEASPVSIRGGRYDELARQYFKTQTPAVGVVFSYKPTGDTSAREYSLPKVKKKPKIYFIRLGYAAELKSFHILETMRKARIPLLQHLGESRLSEQLNYAEERDIPYTMIMGQKEALENAVIIRETATRTQQTITIDHLPEFFKAL